jgi:chromosome partitioning protein
MIISIANQKGGVGKTLMSYHLAYLFAEKGKTLVIDLDYQSNLTSYVLGSEEKRIDKQNEISNIFNNDVPEPLKIKDNFFLLGASNDLHDFAGKTDFKNFFKLKNYLEKIKPICNFDYIIIDTPPNLGLFSTNAFLVSDNIISPIDSSLSSVSGFKMLLEINESMRNELNFDIKVLGCFLNNYADNKADRKILKEVEKKYPELLFKSIIPRTTKIKEANQDFKSIFEVDPSNKASRAIKQLFKEILDRSENAGK